LWTVGSDARDSRTARFLVMATGCLSEPNWPDIEGRDDFEGASYLTGLWPHEGVDFTGQKVAVIGTGSSGIQSIPIIAGQADELTVFQRTPNFAIPAWNHDLDEQYIRDIKARYGEMRAQARMERAGFIGSNVQNEDYALDLDEETIETELHKRWESGGLRFMTSYADMGVSLESNEIAAEFVRERIREKVNDPDTAEKLCPDSYPIGTKRLCVDIDYYETYNQDHVDLVDLRETPIERITAKGIETSEKAFEFDAIVFATGFDAMTGTLAKIDIAGRGGAKLKDKWADGPRTYLGLMTADYPNLFLVTGPQSPSVLSNMIVSIEQHVEWISDCIERVDQGCIEPAQQAEDDWVEHNNLIANLTVYPYANSWYMGANIPGKPRIFTAYIGGVGEYRQICEAVATRGYAGCIIDGNPSNGTVDPMEFLETDERLVELAMQREPA
ncbi:MAG: NAD(P)/FAD-dependent oxidoreductase, partial [Sphingomonadaceae bacterium]|nr:NAD(P)/FAD-dependent oxidoreductase [Sphingomonadaceae bacterium]